MHTYFFDIATLLSPDIPFGAVTMCNSLNNETATVAGSGTYYTCMTVVSVVTLPLPIID